jgi:protein PhnA
MSLERELAARSNGNCELCSASEDLNVFVVTPKSGSSANEAAHVCGKCNDQLTGTSDIDSNHWRCLNDSMWSEVSAVKVIAYRMLHQLKSEGWPADLLDMMYLEDDDLKWAKEGVEDDSEDKIIHRDSNGVQLLHGDSVVVIKDLKVAGSSLVAKRGTAVRNITLVHDNAEHIEGKVEGQRIVILTQYVKK